MEMQSNVGLPHIVLYSSKTESYLWCPELMDGITITERNLPLAEWYEVDRSQKLINPCDPLFKSRAVDGFVEVRVALVFFHDKTYEDIVGYAPGFGRVGSFVKNNLTKDQFYEVWIRYFDMFQNVPMQHFLTLFDVKWLLRNEHYIALSPADLRSNPYRGLSTFFSFCKGVVVSEHSKGGEIYYEKRSVSWNAPSKSNGFEVGHFVHFIPMRNLSGKWIAVNTYASEPNQSDGFHVIKKHPLQMVVKHWRSLGLNTVEVPGICSSMRSRFNVSGEMVLEKRPLVIEFDIGSMEFVAISFISFTKDYCELVVSLPKQSSLSNLSVPTSPNGIACNGSAKIDQNMPRIQRNDKPNASYGQPWGGRVIIQQAAESSLKKMKTEYNLGRVKREPCDDYADEWNDPKMLGGQPAKSNVRSSFGEYVRKRMVSELEQGVEAINFEYKPLPIPRRKRITYTRAEMLNCREPEGVKMMVVALPKNYRWPMTRDGGSGIGFFEIYVRVPPGLTDIIYKKGVQYVDEIHREILLHFRMDNVPSAHIHHVVPLYLFKSCFSFLRYKNSRDALTVYNYFSSDPERLRYKNGEYFHLQYPFNFV